MAKKKVKKTLKKAVKKVAHKKAAPKKSAKKAAAKKPAAHAEKKTTSINPYLTFAGNCEEAFNFYKSVFGGKFAMVSRFKDMPPMEGHALPASELNKIMHMSLPISKGTILMGSDTSEAFGHTNVVGNNFSISVDTPNNKTADKLFNGLSSGGKVTMPMAKTFWGSYFGMCVDKFCIQWMVSVEEVQPK
jgi:PhnB protein